MSWLAGSLAGVLLAQPIPMLHHGPVSLKVQPTATPLVFELEFANRSKRELDVPLSVTLVLQPTSAAPERYPTRSTLWSSVDPNTGEFGGFFADKSITHLRLQAHQLRAVRVDLARLKWSLGPGWVWTARELWQMVEPGPYELSAGINAASPMIQWYAGPMPVSMADE